MKDADKSEVEDVAIEMKKLCAERDATFIVDDHVDVCLRVGADGVHLGKKDMKPSDARRVLGDKFIIGGTCNTYADVLRVADSVDYVGCGPFRFTTTKKNLAPVLGLDGYERLVWQCRSNGINIPMVAIGGITVADIASILSSGPDGIALSGEIAKAADPVGKTHEVISEIIRYKSL